MCVPLTFKLCISLYILRAAVRRREKMIRLGGKNRIIQNRGKWKWHRKSGGGKKSQFYCDCTLVVWIFCHSAYNILFLAILQVSLTRSLWAIIPVAFCAPPRFCLCKHRLPDTKAIYFLCQELIKENFARLLCRLQPESCRFIMKAIYCSLRRGSNCINICPSNKNADLPLFLWIYVRNINSISADLNHTTS